MKYFKKGKILFVITCLMFFARGNLLAETNQQPIRADTIELGTEISYITYKEPLIKEYGIMYGFLGAYTHRGPFSYTLDKGMLKVEGRISFGQVNYDGQLQDGTPYTIDDINDFMWEVRGLGGYDFSMFTDTTLTPYFGLGYRKLSDDLSKDPAGYKREANYFYSPVGLEVITQASKWMGYRR